jgi:hypothetical protein
VHVAARIVEDGPPLLSHRSAHPLRLHYDELLDNGTKPNLAKLTIARRIAAIVLSMWKKEEAYQRDHDPRVKAA